MAQTLRQRREALNLTLAAMAQKVGISESRLSRIERTGRTSMDTARAIAAATGLSIEEITTPPPVEDVEHAE
jgi:transcriptional regulator with XRE-family HTH domain